MNTDLGNSLEKRLCKTHVDCTLLVTDHSACSYFLAYLKNLMTSTFWKLIRIAPVCLLILPSQYWVVVLKTVYYFLHTALLQVYAITNHPPHELQTTQRRERKLYIIKASKQN
jgi:hypothetical protein